MAVVSAAFSYRAGRNRGRRRAQIEIDREEERMDADPLYRKKRLSELNAELKTIDSKIVRLEKFELLLGDLLYRFFYSVH